MDSRVMFPFPFEDQIKSVSKIRADEFTPLHHEILAQMHYHDFMLWFPDDRWRCRYLGAGEEKAVFCVCDHENRVFAIEVIDERHYLNGRFVGGDYFFKKTLHTLANVRANPDSEFGLMFSGLVKSREFVYGYEWDRFQFDPRRTQPLDALLTAYLQALLMSRFNEYSTRYKDVHGRNVMFEIREWSQPGIPVICKDWLGRLKIAKVGLQPIDVR
jgi:hypothetical protein